MLPSRQPVETSAAGIIKRKGIIPSYEEVFNVK